MNLSECLKGFIKTKSAKSDRHFQYGCVEGGETVLFPYSLQNTGDSTRIKVIKTNDQRNIPDPSMMKSLKR